NRLYRVVASRQALRVTFGIAFRAGWRHCGPFFYPFRIREAMMKRNAIVVSALGLLVFTTCAVFAQQAPAKKTSAKAGKHYTLPATKENVQWGWFDVNEKPKLTVESGDTVSVETWYHALDQIKP